MKLFSKSLLGNEQFPALTGIRAIAAFMVFFHHLPLHLKFTWLTGLQLSFYSGVTLFFVLIGFLITWHYYKEVTFNRSWLYKYFTNRIARIYPVYFLVLSVVILIIKNHDPIFLLQNFTLTHNLFFLFPSHGMAITPSWSLTVEECFYLLAPLIFLLSRKYSQWNSFALTIGVLILVLFTYGDGSLEQTFFPVFMLSFFGNVMAFFAGIYIGLLLLKQETNSRPGSKCMPWTTAGIIGIIIITAVLAYATNKPTHEKYILMITGNCVLLPIPIAMLLYGLVREKSFIKNLLSTNIFRLLGRSSYVFYLLHLPLIDYLAKPYIMQYFGPGLYNVFVLLIFLLAIAISVIIFILYEHPVNTWLRKFAGLRPSFSKK